VKHSHHVVVGQDLEGGGGGGDFHFPVCSRKATNFAKLKFVKEKNA
jgi:hypothetical protein